MSQDEKFPDSICRKFPVQTGRHIKSGSNARWMLRNPPIEPLNKKEIDELIAISRSESKQ